MSERSFATWSKVPTEVEFLSSLRDWEIGVLYPPILTFLRDGSWVLEKSIPGSERSQKAYLVFKSIYCIHISKPGESTYNFNFAKLNALRN